MGKNPTEPTVKHFIGSQDINIQIENFWREIVRGKLKRGLMRKMQKQENHIVDKLKGI